MTSRAVVACFKIAGADGGLGSFITGVASNSRFTQQLDGKPGFVWCSIGTHTLSFR